MCPDGKAHEDASRRDDVPEEHFSEIQGEAYPVRRRSCPGADQAQRASPAHGRGVHLAAVCAVPYPGLYLTMQRPRRRGDAKTLYLRVRTVEWEVRPGTFRCLVDEVLGSNVFSETFEVRGSPRIEKHFLELQRTLCTFGFNVQTDVSTQLALDKDPDGTWMVPPPHFVPPPVEQTGFPRRRRFGSW
jgi:hypothetical protein